MGKGNYSQERGKRMKKLLFIFALLILVGEGLASRNDVSKEAVHKIDDLLFRRMSVVMKKINENKLLATKDKYNKDYADELERSQVHLEYLQDKLKIMGKVKNEIDRGYVELDSLLKKFPKGKPGHKLISTFNKYFFAYKKFMDALDKYLKNQINACILWGSVIKLETNQQLFFDALDNDDVEQAQTFFEKESELISNYDNKFKSVDFKGKIPSGWATEFRNTYDKMHEWHSKFLEAKKQKNESLYKDLRLESFELIVKIPYEKSLKFRTEVENILFERNPEIENLEKKSVEAGREAYQLYFIQKTDIGEDPNEVWDKIKKLGIGPRGSQEPKALASRK